MKHYTIGLEFTPSSRQFEDSIIGTEIITTFSNNKLYVTDEITSDILNSDKKFIEVTDYKSMEKMILNTNCIMKVCKCKLVKQILVNNGNENVPDSVRTYVYAMGLNDSFEMINKFGSNINSVN